MKKNYRFYYILGGIFLSIGVIGAVIGLSLTMIFPGNEIAGWSGVIICILTVVLSFFSIFLLKKGNFLKLNYKLSNKNDEKTNKKM